MLHNKLGGYTYKDDMNIFLKKMFFCSVQDSKLDAQGQHPFRSTLEQKEIHRGHFVVRLKT